MRRVVGIDRKMKRSWVDAVFSFLGNLQLKAESCRITQSTGAKARKS
jgi:hypothetical protein